MSWKIIVDMENCPYLGIESCSHVDGSQYCNESTCPLKDLRETNKVHISREDFWKLMGLADDFNAPLYNKLLKEVEQK